MHTPIYFRGLSVLITLIGLSMGTSVIADQNDGYVIPGRERSLGELLNQVAQNNPAPTSATVQPQPLKQVQPSTEPNADPSSASQSWGEDIFENTPTGYTLYKNARYAFSILYPGTYFAADPPSGSGDGRRFVSVDGQASFLVYAQFEALGRNLDQTLGEDRQTFDRITSERIEQGAYQLSGLREGQSVLRRVLRDQNDMTRIFEITYPAARHDEFENVARYMAASFAPPPQLAQVKASVPQPPIQPQIQPQVTTPTVAPRLGDLYTPARGTGERAAMMDAARVPVVPAIGQRVIFVVDVLNSDGHWAFLQGTPVNPDGTPLQWSKTNFARDWAADVMSDVVMVLMRNEGGKWHAVDWAIGPTDVAWYDWITSYGLPERLFSRD